MKRLVVEIDVMPLTLDTSNLIDYAGMTIGACLSDPPFGEGDGASPAQSGLCELAWHDRACTQWTLRVDDNAHWSDGRAVSGEHVSAAITRAASKAGSPEGRLGKELLRCRASENIVELSLRRPLGYLPEMLSAPAFSPIAADRGPDERSTDGVPPTVGPFRVRGQLAGRRGLVLDAVPHARLLAAGAAEEVLLFCTTSPREGVALFEAGEVDVTSPTTFPWRDLDRFRRRLETAPLNLAIDLWFNRSGFDRLDRHSREALSLALDRQRLAEAIDNIMRPGWRWADLWAAEVADVPLPSPDRRARARRSLLGGLPREISVGFPDFPPNRDILDAVAAQWADEFDIDLAMVPLAYRDYVADGARIETDLTLSLWGACWPDPSSMLSAFSSTGPIARWYGWKSADFDVKLREAEGRETAPTRLAGYRAANDILLADHIVIPLLHATGNYLCQPRLQRAKLRRSGALPLWQVAEAAAGAPAGLETSE